MLTRLVTLTICAGPWNWPGQGRSSSPTMSSAMGRWPIRRATIPMCAACGGSLSCWPPSPGSARRRSRLSAPRGMTVSRSRSSEPRAREAEGMSSPGNTPGGERAELLETLAKHRYFLRHTVRGLTDEQAARRTTVSELCLGGLIKHVSLTERQWISFIREGPSAMAGGDAEDVAQDWSQGFRMLETETLAGLLEEYEQVARRTDELVA